jgi:hypothetical protein
MDYTIQCDSYQDDTGGSDYNGSTRKGRDSRDPSVSFLSFR